MLLANENNQRDFNGFSLPHVDRCSTTSTSLAVISSIFKTIYIVLKHLVLFGLRLSANWHAGLAFTVKLTQRVNRGDLVFTFYIKTTMMEPATLDGKKTLAALPPEILESIIEQVAFVNG